MAQLFNRRGGEVLVNTETLNGQSGAQVEMLAGGGFVVAWSDGSGTGGDNQISGIKAQLFDSAGNKVGGEFLVNTTIAGVQQTPKIAALPSGRFVISWFDDSAAGADTSGRAVRAQLFEANGAKVGGEFVVNTTTTGDQVLHSIGELAGGGFAVAWTDFSGLGGDASGSSVKLQLFDASANKVGGELLVNTTTLNGQSSPTIVGLAGGGIAIAWRDSSLTGGDTSNTAIRMQLFDAAGNKVGGEQLVNTATANAQFLPAIAALEGGGFVVTWQDSSLVGDPSGTGIKAQIYDAAGNRVGGELLVNTETGGDQHTPHVESLPGGGFIVSWQGSVAAANDVRAQVFDAGGNKVGVEFVINQTTAGDQGGVKIARLPSGELAVVWNDNSGVGGDSSNFGVKLQILEPATSGATDIMLSNATVSETAVENLPFATLSAAGGALNAGFSYAIVSDSTGGAFRIDGDRLVVDDNGKLDFETHPTAQVRIRATDSDGNSFEETLNLTVADAAVEARYSAGDEFMVNVDTLGFNTPGAVVPLAAGGFVLVSRFLTPGAVDSDGTRGRVFDAAGNSVGDEFDFEISGPDNQTPAAAPLASGGFVLAYEGPRNADSSGTTIMAQRFDASGAEIGAELLVSTTTSGILSSPAAAGLETGGFVVAWRLPVAEDPADTAPFPSQIVAQIFDAAGNRVGTEFRVNDLIEGDQTEPRVAALPGGGFVVTWSDPAGLHGKLFNSTGGAVGPQFSIAVADPMVHGLSALEGGDFLVSWLEETGSGLFTVWGQLYRAGGTASGSPVALASDIEEPSVAIAAVPGGGFVLSYTDGGDAWAKLFDGTMAQAGDTIAVASSADDDQIGSVAALEGGELVFAWTRFLVQDNSVTSDAYARIVSPALSAIDGTPGNDSLAGTAGPDEINGLDGNDTLSGDAGNDALAGGAGTDTLNGGAGHDELDGGADADTMAGGLGDDVYFVDAAGDVVTENPGEGNDEVRTGLSSHTLAANVERLTGTSASGQALTGNALANLISGGTGTDTMAGAGGDDVYVVAAGDVVVEGAGQGNDEVRTALASYTLTANVEKLTGTSQGGQVLTGNAGANTITGGDGNDTLDGAGGADTLAGGRGNDTYVVDAADIVVELGGSDSGRADSVRTALAAYTLADNVEILVGTSATGQALTGNSGSNQIMGGAGNDILDGGAGTDNMSGGLGDDVYYVEHSEFVTEAAGQGTDEIRTHIFGYTLGDNFENLTGLSGSGHWLRGNALDNIITGGTNNDRLDGGLGSDTLIGGLGDDNYENVGAGDVVVEQSGQGIDRVETALAAYTLGANVENLTGTGSSGQTLTGNALANQIVGSSHNDVIDGGAGADSMAGGLGNDTYVVDNAGDVVTEAAAAGTDTVESSVTHMLGANVENLVLTGTAAVNGTGNGLVNSLTGNSAANRLDGGGSADSMAGGLGNDTYVVDVAGDSVTEAAASGNDTVESAISYTLGANLENLVLTGSAANGTGNGLANSLTGNASANRLDGGAGADTMAGAGGNDTYVVDNVGDVVTEASGAGTDTVESALTFTLGANVENLVLTGTAAINGTGNGLANSLTGNAAANRLDGGLGADTMAGGAGDDTYVVDDAGDLVTEASGSGKDLVRSSVTHTLGANVEKLTLTGTAAINGTGNALGNSLLGNSAANILDGGGGADAMAGGAGNDTYYVDNLGDRVSENSGEGTDTVNSSVSFSLTAHVDNLVLAGSGAINATGNSAANTITGNSAANLINGGGGADSMAGAGGNDIYIVDNVGDVVTELAGEGTDLVKSTVTFTLGANVERLTLRGGAAINGTGNDLANTIAGNEAANILDGGTGADKLIGAGGNDVYVVDNIADQAIEASSGGGTDTVQSSVTFAIGDNIEALTLTGVAAINGTGNDIANTLTGNSAANVLDGGRGNDSLAGGGGDDSLRGGLGNDTLQGDVGADDFVFDKALGATNVDTILDFAAGTDTIVLENAVFKGLAAGAFNANALAIGTAAGDADDRIVYDPTTGNLYYDADGTGAAAQILFATLDNAPATLSASDFAVI